MSVASGKGGTGKTTIAANLALALVNLGRRVTYVDCDVEEPNGHIFLAPELSDRQAVDVMVPQVDLARCTFCGECSQICQYNAIAVLARQVMIFPSLCHSCGGCFHICPEQAIREVPRSIGEINMGVGKGVSFHEGRLNVGEAISPPITRALRKSLPTDEIVIIDAPPGTSCPAIAAVKDTDFVILVTEPTPFGLSDLRLAIEMVQALGRPFGVIINRSDIGDDNVEQFCRGADIDILMKIRFDRKLAESYAIGGLLLAEDPGYSESLCNVYRHIEERMEPGGTGRSER
jgi:MinD superfamily P-loop ATPase